MAAPGTPGYAAAMAMAVRECFCCKRSSNDVPWNQTQTLNKGTGEERRIPFGDLCQQCPKGVKFGQYGLTVQGLREKCAKDVSFGPGVQKAGSTAEEMALTPLTTPGGAAQFDAKEGTSCLIEFEQHAVLYKTPEAFQQSEGFNPEERGLEKSSFQGRFGEEVGWVAQDKTKPSSVIFKTVYAVSTASLLSCTSRQVRPNQGVDVFDKRAAESTAQCPRVTCTPYGAAQIDRIKAEVCAEQDAAAAVAAAAAAEQARVSTAQSS
eukprot:8751342-Pyramimonas_sp.AAC.2